MFMICNILTFRHGPFPIKPAKIKPILSVRNPGHNDIYLFMSLFNMVLLAFKALNNLEADMKGVVFRSFESFVAKRFGDEITEDAMALPSLSTGGAFTNVGDYPPSDFLTLAISVAEQTKTPITELVTDFGEALFHILASAHADMVKAYDNAIALLSVIENVIHRDVRKLYTNAQLPRFDILDRQGDNYLHMDYSSARPFADLAEGLIKGCLDHFDVKEISSIIREDIKTDGTHSRFKVSINQNGTDG